MIELFEQNIITEDRQSSKGNQLKWKSANNWYKSDYTGYEGFSEYVISQLLQFSTLDSKLLVSYDTEEIIYKNNKYLGCISKDFLTEGWSMITLERLFHNFFGQSLYKSIFRIQDKRERLRFLVDQVERITGLKEFGKYMCLLLTIDAVFLNEDRHTHNIAVLKNEKNEFQYCPIFDNGAGLLSDTQLDYPIGGELENYIEEVTAKTFASCFDEQLDIAEDLYGMSIKFHYTTSVLKDIVFREQYYNNDVKERVYQLLLLQKRKYDYLFSR